MITVDPCYMHMLRPFYALILILLILLLAALKLKRKTIGILYKLQANFRQVFAVYIDHSLMRPPLLCAVLRCMAPAPGRVIPTAENSVQTCIAISWRWRAYNRPCVRVKPKPTFSVQGQVTSITSSRLHVFDPVMIPG